MVLDSYLIVSVASRQATFRTTREPAYGISHGITSSGFERAVAYACALNVGQKRIQVAAATLLKGLIPSRLLRWARHYMPAFIKLGLSGRYRLNLGRAPLTTFALIDF
jgi:hypothetical protein